MVAIEAAGTMTVVAGAGVTADMTIEDVVMMGEATIGKGQAAKSGA
ncbi:hypothetical protein J3Q05_07185 [Pseudomonas sp. D1-2]